MSTRRLIGEFVTQHTLGLAGASRGGRKFGNTVLRELRGKGYEIVPVHPEVGTVDGVECVPTVADLPSRTGGLIVVVPPEAAVTLVEQAAAHGIPRVWLQQGAESDAAVARGAALGVDVVPGECVLMFAEPTAFVHRVHRWIRGAIGKLPE